MTVKTLVVPLDGSEFAERALPVAIAIADHIGGRLLLVAVQEHGPVHPREYLEEIAARFPRVTVETAVVEDRYPADAIISILEASDDRIACMTSHGRGGLRWGIVGSVAEEVVRRADRPTLLVGRNCREDALAHASTMLVCVDGSESSERLAPVAMEWADELGFGVRAAIVVHPLDVESAEHSDKLLDPIVQTFGGPEHAKATMLTSRYPEGALADYAEDLPAALVAMNCHGRTGLARIALGSTTMGVLHQSPCPLLVTSIRPTPGENR